MFTGKKGRREKIKGGEKVVEGERKLKSGKQQHKKRKMRGSVFTAGNESWLKKEKRGDEVR